VHTRCCSSLNRGRPGCEPRRQHARSCRCSRHSEGLIWRAEGSWGPGRPQCGATMTAAFGVDPRTALAALHDLPLAARDQVLSKRAQPRRRQILGQLYAGLLGPSFEQTDPVTVGRDRRGPELRPARRPEVPQGVAERASVCGAGLRSQSGTKRCSSLSRARPLSRGQRDRDRGRRDRVESGSSLRQ
jgi:hypothetical protein